MMIQSQTTTTLNTSTLNTTSNVNDGLTRIKQQGISCRNCGKVYKRRTALDKHLLLCELVLRSDNKIKSKSNKMHSKNGNSASTTVYEDDEADSYIPSNKDLYQVVFELVKKYELLEKKVDKINKYVIKEKKKINILDWLNNNHIPNTTADSMMEEIGSDENVSNISNISNVSHLIIGDNKPKVSDIVCTIMSNKLGYTDGNIMPMVSFTQNPNTIYIFNEVKNNASSSQSQEKKWLELSKEKLTTYLVSIHMYIVKQMSKWKQDNKARLENDTNLRDAYDKAFVKVMGFNSKSELYYSKAKTMMCVKVKKDIKAFIEYEFEF